MSVLPQEKTRARVATWLGPLTPAHQASRPQDLLAAEGRKGCFPGGLWAMISTGSR